MWMQSAMWSWHRNDALWSAAQLRGAVTHYRIDEGFCDGVRSKFREDLVLFPWTGGLNCDDLGVEVRNGLDAWEANSQDLRFRETKSKTDAEIVVVATDLPVESALGGATSFLIAIDTDACWYTDRRFCHAVQQYTFAIHLGLSLLFVVALMCVVFFLSRPVPPRSGPARLVAWGLLFAVPWCFFGSILPCLQCYDFGAVVMHETGHVLGLAHPDEAAVVGASTHYVGCGGDATPTNATPRDTTTIMNSAITYRPDSCLSRDDVDAVRTLYKGNCSEPVWCYETTPSLSTGTSRLALAFLYGFALAWLAVVLRNSFDKRRRQKDGF